MKDRHVRRAAASLDLTSADQLTEAALLEAAARHLGKPIRVTETPPVDLDVNLTCGLSWSDRDGASLYIWVTARTAGRHRLFVIAHEIGHFLLGHEPVPVEEFRRAPDKPFRFLSDGFRAGNLLGHGRDHGSSRAAKAHRQQESEADAFAAFLLAPADNCPADDDEDPLINRLRRNL